MSALTAVPAAHSSGYRSTGEKQNLHREEEFPLIWLKKRLSFTTTWRAPTRGIPIVLRSEEKLARASAAPFTEIVHLHAGNLASIGTRGGCRSIPATWSAATGRGLPGIYLRWQWNWSTLLGEIPHSPAWWINWWKIPGRESFFDIRDRNPMCAAEVFL